jgi:hypothetical protein
MIKKEADIDLVKKIVGLQIDKERFSRAIFGE